MNGSTLSKAPALLLIFESDCTVVLTRSVTDSRVIGRSRPPREWDFDPECEGRPDWSDQPDVTFDRLDHIVHLSAPDLFGHAKGKAFGGVQRNMRR